MAEPEIIPAATLVLMRERAVGVPELLIVERAATMRFAGGALVFPGGRIDPGDHELALLTGGGEDLAARIAAVRETLEETGIAIGLDPLPDGRALTELRAALHEGLAIGEALRLAGTRLATDVLVPFARWCPRGVHHRIFDTHFFLARAPEQLPEPVIDGGETARAFWASAAEVLARADRGEAHIIFPTRRNLERLAQFASFGEAVADAHAHPVRTVTPWIEERDGVRQLCIPDDLGYPVTAEPVEQALRG